MQRGGGGATMCVLATVSLSDVSGVFCGVIFHQWVYIGLMLPCNTGKPCFINTHFIKLGGVLAGEESKPHLTKSTVK